MNTATVRCHPGAQLNNGINASGDANLCISATHGAACPAAKSCAQTWQSVWELAAPQPGLLFSIYLLVVLYIAYMQYDIHECFICVSGNRYVWALPVGLSRLLSSLCSLMCPVFVFVYSVLNCAGPGDISDIYVQCTYSLKDLCVLVQVILLLVTFLYQSKPFLRVWCLCGFKLCIFFVEFIYFYFVFGFCFV